MKTKDRDFASYLAIVDSFIDQSSLPQTDAALIKQELKTFITVRFKKDKWVPPEITKFCTDWYREFYRMVDGQDPYKLLKQKSNEEALKTLRFINSENLQECIAASIVGNKIDYGACLLGTYDLNQLKHDLEHLRDFPLHVDETAIFKQKLKTAQTVLFLPDNNGEIIFDTLLLKKIKEQVGKENLFIMGKETPMLNDVTVSELSELHIDDYGQIVSSGSNCFGLHTEDVSDECKNILNQVDLIIAKGQAYMEFFTEYNFSNVIHLLTVKYPIISPAFGTLPSGYNVVMCSERYAHLGKNYFGGNTNETN